MLALESHYCPLFRSCLYLKFQLELCKRLPRPRPNSLKSLFYPNVSTLPTEPNFFPNLLKKFPPDLPGYSFLNMSVDSGGNPARERTRFRLLKNKQIFLFRKIIFWRNSDEIYSNFKTFLFHFYKLLLRQKNLKAWAGLPSESGKQGINPKGDPLGSSPLSI